MLVGTMRLRAVDALETMFMGMIADREGDGARRADDGGSQPGDIVLDCGWRGRR